MQKVYVVYGNHGKSPVQLEDYHRYLCEALTQSGFEPLFAEDPIPGEFNILIEYFSVLDQKKIREASATPGTRFIVIATEFITGKTFNNFSKDEAKAAFSKIYRLPKWMGMALKAILPVFFPEFLRVLMLETYPKPYIAGREIYYSLVGYPQHTTYGMMEYWRNRFRYFEAIVPYCDSIWCVTPHQLEAYQRHFGRQIVHLMPMVSWAKDCANPLQNQIPKDIDFLFTGSLTSYRREVLKRLESVGFKVVVGPTTWPTYMRDHYVARSKICLQIRQDPNWRYPSVMRYHHLLCSGAVVVAEQGREACLQEDFIDSVVPEDFLAECARQIKMDEFYERGQEAQQRYFIESEKGRRDFTELLTPYRNQQPAPPPKNLVELQ